MHFLPTYIKHTLYQTLINPHVNCCLLVWGHKCTRLTKLQKRYIRLINLSKHNAHCDPLFKLYKILQIPDTLRLQELKFYYKFIHNTLPYYLQLMPFHLNQDIRSQYTRRRNAIHIQPVQHEFAKRSIRHNIPKTVNNSPHIIVNNYGFTNYMDLQSYSNQCTIPNCYICQHVH